MALVIRPGHDLQETYRSPRIAFAVRPVAVVDVLTEAGLVPRDGAEQRRRCLARSRPREKRGLRLVHDDRGDILGDRFIALLRVGQSLVRIAANLDAGM